MRAAPRAIQGSSKESEYMARHCYRSSRPDSWNVPRQEMHPSQRIKVYGPIQPMDQGKQGWLSRLFRRS